MKTIESFSIIQVPGKKQHDDYFSGSTGPLKCKPKYFGLSRPALPPSGAEKIRTCIEEYKDINTGKSIFTGRRGRHSAQSSLTKDCLISCRRKFCPKKNPPEKGRRSSSLPAHCL
jgi:hypothetical protein